MGAGLKNEALRWLDTLAHEGSCAGLGDAELLERFLEGKPEARELAFEALVRRHGPMVLARCRRVMGDSHAADDAFQAAFLVLAQRATSVRQREDLGPWLSRVAVRVAHRARKIEAHRRLRETRVAATESQRCFAATDASAQEVAAIVREETRRLPRVDRVLLRLTYWRGKTYEEAASQLDMPVGTVRSRLSRVRESLRVRLLRRGVAPAVAAGAASEATAAQVSEALVLQTARAALVPAGELTAAVQAGTIPAAVATLVRAELAAIAGLSLKSIAIMLLLGAAATAGAVQIRRNGREAVQPEVPQTKPRTELAAAAASAKPNPPAPKPPGPAIDREAWAKKLASLSEADWRRAFAVGQELAALPAEEGFAILSENWVKINKPDSRQQVLKAFRFATHPRLLETLDLGMRDRSPEVQSWAVTYLNDIAFQDFSEDFSAYKKWYEANRGKPLADVVAGSAKRYAAEAAKANSAEATTRARWLAHHAGMLRELPEARRAMLDAGLLQTLERWAAGAAPNSPRADLERVTSAVNVIGQLGAGEKELRRAVVPHLAKGNPIEVRGAAASALEGRQNAWATDILLDVLKQSLAEGPESVRTLVWSAASTLASFDDAGVIPTMIAVIDADNQYDTVYGVGYFGLSKLTGVEYDESHKGAWWRAWWEKNKERYPDEVRKLTIPTLAHSKQASTAPAQEDPLADVADVPVEDLHADGDTKKRYFLIGKRSDQPPREGYSLLVVLPGGDGSADFQPFVRRIYKNTLSERWLIAQAVAPQWDKEQFDKVVWPTAASRYPAAKFTTEDLVAAIVRDVQSKMKLNPRRIVLLGWSSGGPPCYAAALTKNTPVTAAFVAMSAFRPEQLPSLSNAKGRAFYLLQSPQDQVTPMLFAVQAEKALKEAGASVHLERYEGGHGWRGDVWTMMRDAVEWIEKNTERD